MNDEEGLRGKGASNLKVHGVESEILRCSGGRDLQN